MFDLPKISEITPDTCKGFYMIDNDAYHASHGVSSTTVKKALGSYASFTMPRKEKACFNFGTAVHMAVLEPHLFEKNYVKAPDIPGHKNSNAYKEAYADFVSKNVGRQVIDADEYMAICEIAVICQNHPGLQHMTYQPEVAAVTRCKDTDLVIKCKADMFGTTVIDLKTTSFGVKPHEFIGEVVKYGYHISAAFYQDIIADVLGGQQYAPTMKILAVDTREPHDCSMFVLNDKLLDEGRKLYKAGLRRIKKWNSLPTSAVQMMDYGTYELDAVSRVTYNTQDILRYIGEGT